MNYYIEPSNTVTHAVKPCDDNNIIIITIIILPDFKFNILMQIYNTDK